MSATAPPRMNPHRSRRKARLGIFEQLRRLDDDPILWCGCTATSGAAECHDEQRSTVAAVLHEVAA